MSAEALLLLPAILSLVVVLAFWARSPAKLGQELGPVEWGFTDSWASSLTPILALFQVFVGLGLLPDPGAHFSKPTYALFAVLFALIVAAAPLAYLAAGRLEYEFVNGQSVLYVHGSMPGLALSAFLVQWGIWGQTLATLILALDLIANTDIPRLITGTAVVVASLIVLLSFLHAFKSTRMVFGEIATRLAPGSVQSANSIPWYLP